MLLSLTSFQRENATRGKENKMSLSIKYIDAILRFIVKEVPEVDRESRTTKCDFPAPAPPIHFSFTLSATRKIGKVAGARGSGRERKVSLIRGF